MDRDALALQEIIETVPHGLLEQVALFCQDNEKRQCILHKTDKGFRVEYKVIELINR